MTIFPLPQQPKENLLNFTTEDMKALLASGGESEDCHMFLAADEFEFVDEEERSELEEIEEDRIFYSSRMCLNSASNRVA